MKGQIVIILHSNAVDLLHILLDTGHFLGPLQTEFHIAGRTVGAVVELDALMDLEFPSVSETCSQLSARSPTISEFSSISMRRL